MGLLALQDPGQEGPAVLHPLDPVHAAGRGRDPALPDVPARVHRPAGHPARPDPRLLGVQPAVHDLDDEGLHRRGPGRVRGGRDARRVLALRGLLARDDAAADPGHRRHGGVRADLLLERVRVLDLPDHDAGDAHGAGGDRRPDRRHDDRLGPGGRVGDGVRGPGADLRLPRPQAPRGGRDARGGEALMAEVLVKRLHKAFPDGTVAVEELDLTIADGELFVMLGPSGCGKTTTLRCIAGLEEETSGQIFIGDELVSGLRPSAARHRDGVPVLRAVSAPDRARQHGVPAARGEAAGVRGQRARARGGEDAPARAVPDPQAEQAVRRRAAARRARPRDGAPPEGVPDGRAADEPRRRAARRHARRAQARPAAAELDDDLRDPRPDRGDGARATGSRSSTRAGWSRSTRRCEVYNRPASLFAARFIGSPPMNLIEAEVTNGALTAAGGLKIAAPEGLKRGDKVIAGVRPERLTVERVGRRRARRGSCRARRSATRRSTWSRPRPGCCTCGCRRRRASRRSRSCPCATPGAAPPAYDPTTEKVVSR